MRPCLISMCLIASLPLCVGASAASVEPGIGKTVTVTHADLDLASHAGLARLDGRIHAAVSLACNVDTGLGPARQAMMRNACVTQARADADKAVALAISRHRDNRYAGRNSGEGTMVSARWP